MLTINIKKEKENFLYWFAGNIITIVIGLLLFIIIYYSGSFRGGDIFIDGILILIMPLFVGSFLIKFFNIELPIYYYGTVGLIYHAMFLAFICYSKEVKFSAFLLGLIKLIPITIIISIAGGMTVNIIKKIKKW
jgi:hypothetical protein